MKKLMMVLAIGLALSSVGFARDRDDFNRGSGRVVERHFVGQGDREVRVVRRDRDRDGVVLGFSYDSAPAYYAPEPAYCPPVVDRAVVRRDFDRDHHRDRDRDREDRRGFRR